MPELSAPRRAEEAPALQARSELRSALADSGVKIAVIDDDPTGTQTVRDVPVALSCEQPELEWAMRAADPLFCVLTNTRALAEPDAVAINRELGERLPVIGGDLGAEVRVISRSDSTLRGHFPAETAALAAGLGAAGEPIDAVLLCPAYPEAGRVTKNDTHYLCRDGRMVPVAETEFARDPAFGYRSSDLRAWIGERAGERSAIASLGLADIRESSPDQLAALLAERAAGAEYVIANALEPSDLERIALAVDLAESGGLRLIYRTGPSFLGARAGRRTPAPLHSEEIAMPDARGLLVVGSYTELSTAQLQEAETRHELGSVMLDVDRVLRDDDSRQQAVQEAVAALRAELDRGDAALVTSRASAHRSAGAESLEVGARIAATLVDVVAATLGETRVDWLIAKGGITSHDLAVKALSARRAIVLGQLLPGQVSVWELGEDALLPGLRYVVFPGNVGDRQALAEVLARLKGCE